jgi:hypothetical protein
VSQAHEMSSKRLQSYVNEYAFGYNHRSDDAPIYAPAESQVREGEARTLRRLRTYRVTKETALQGGLRDCHLYIRAGLRFSDSRLGRPLRHVKRTAGLES